MAAAIEVARPIAFATFIVMAVFLPLFAMSGIEGKMYRPISGSGAFRPSQRRWSSRLRSFLSLPRCSCGPRRASKRKTFGWCGS